MSDNIKLLRAKDIPTDKLHAFLLKSFGEIKSNFLIEHGDWWRHGNWNSPALYDEDAQQVVGYTGYITFTILIGGQPVDAIWWGDTFVDRDYRGQRLQSRMNGLMKEDGLVLGFPNAIGAKVYARDDWRIRLGIGEKLTFPFTLMADRRIRYNQKPVGKMARAITPVADPIFRSRQRGKVNALKSQNVHILNNPSAELLSDVFMRYQKTSEVTMAYRDAQHIQWRLLDAPYDMTFYGVGDPEKPDVVLVTRILPYHDLKTLRIIDFFGDIDNNEAVKAAVQAAMKEAADKQVDQIVLITTRPNVNKVCSSLGFYLREDVSFTWFTTDEKQDEILHNCEWHWTISDYDFDMVD